MAYYRKVGIERRYKVARAVCDLRYCWSCGKQISRKELRVVRANDSNHCYCSKECFEKVFDNYTVDFKTGVIKKVKKEQDCNA